MDETKTVRTISGKKHVDTRFWFFRSHTTTDVRSECSPEFLIKVSKRRAKNKRAAVNRRKNRH